MGAGELSGPNGRRQARIRVDGEYLTVYVDGAPYNVVDVSYGGLAIEALWALDLGQTCTVRLEDRCNVTGLIRHVTPADPREDTIIDRFVMGIDLVDDGTRTTFSDAFWECYLNRIIQELEESLTEDESERKVG